ncbi:DUF1292 domain-containing protein [Virgibacillus profundi]|uniref:DUF1292 domain-containing protein n=1 Tax=Virgibacillus profundi TaxID=2024555 RepID=A0A2A2I9Y8_9BACI|nr:DUF1292 domain-containing protein [Virgibacillus profundi]PAV27945.1 DUF1292 domain-containing protein [Virgibacillus profundi]PXY52123.1 DUF1292 domain-containing protein [Virgibacillus profundi]
MDEIEVGEVFTISDETGEDQEVEVLAKVTLEGTDYVAVSFVEDVQDDTEDDIDLYFLRVDDDGEFSAIETDEEFDQVSEAFDEILELEELED